jgi:hypothetical protein
MGRGGNSLNDILTDFSNTSAQVSYIEVSNSSTSSQTLVSQNYINLNFNDSQKSTVSTAEANTLFAKQKLATEYVASNYSTVLQLIANKNQLNSLISNITKVYQNDEEYQKQIRVDLNAASVNKSKI